MTGYSQVVIVGTLVRDPELRFMQSGKEVCNITVAINSSYTTQAGEKKDSVAYVDCGSFGKTAAAIAQYFKKGRPILVSGRLKQDNWEDKTTGKKQSKLSVTIDAFSFLDSQKTEQAAPANNAQASEAPAAGGDDHEVPF